MGSTEADLTVEAQDVINAYAHAAEDEYAALQLLNDASDKSAAYDRAHRDEIFDGDPRIIDVAQRYGRAAELAGEIHVAKQAEERQAAIRLSELAYAGQVTVDAMSPYQVSARHGYWRAAAVVLTALADL